jgi:hypothetical protein
LVIFGTEWEGAGEDRGRGGASDELKDRRSVRSRVKLENKRKEQGTGTRSGMWGGQAEETREWGMTERWVSERQRLKGVWWR